MMAEPVEGRFDYIIVGGGSAGCVMANRLSADPAIRVLLIEAGPDFEPGEEPEAIRDRGVRTIMLPDYFWPDLIVSNGNGVDAPCLQAKVMGGGSSINGMHGQRGVARDYDEWRQLGVEGWGWDDVLPYFRRMETDADVRDDLHGDRGPVQVRRVPESQWSPLTHALRQIFDERGLPRLSDANAGGGDGTMATPVSNTPQTRASAATSYLTREVRARPNLRIMSRTKTSRILFEGRRVSGVQLEDGRTIAAGNVVLSAGALHSPGILLRSGIGPAPALRQAGIAMVCDSPGVGGNLLSHPSFMIVSHLKRAGRQHDRSVRPPVPMLVRYSSGYPACPPTDMQINLWERNPGPLLHDPLNRQMSWFMVLLQKSYSSGHVCLDPSNPSGPLAINFNLLRDDRDLGRIVDAYRLAAHLLLEGPLARLVNNSFIPHMALGKAPDPMTMKLLTDTLQARLISGVGAFAMDYIPGARAKAMADAGLDIRETLAMPEDELIDLMKKIITPGGHPAGTCRMGDPARKGTVVDSRCRVVGVEGLRVVDASIFPSMMNAGPNFPVIMAAEKVSDMIVEDRRMAAPAPAAYVVPIR